LSKLTNYIKNFRNHPLFHRSVSYLSTKQVLKKQIPLLTLFEVFYHQLKKDDISTMAYAIAFNFTFAIFPSMIFLFTVIPYIPIENLDLKILDFLEAIVPSSMYVNMEGTITDIVSKPRGGLLSFGVVVAMYLATNAMDFLITAFNKVYRTRETRNYFVRRLTSFMLTFLLVTVLFMAVVLIIVGKFVINYLHTEGFLMDKVSVYSLFFLKYLVIVLLLLFSLAIVYYFAPTVHKKFAFFSPGTLVATTLTILVSLLYGVYFNNFSTYNRLYGSIGAFIGLMLWLYFIGFILMLGFELNASIEKAHRLENFAKKKTSDVQGE
jgi:membrane protein